jgi:carboxyl-terminal processing protease
MKLDDTPVKGMTLNDAVKRMRGKPDTNITLTVLRKNEAKPLTFTLTRAIIKNKSVKYKLIEPGYGYARVTQFQEHTGPDLAKAIKTMRTENQGEFKGFVLDLRNDPGGLLNGAVGVSAAFLPKDALVVYTEGRVPDSKMRLTVSPENYVRGGGAQSDYMSDIPPELKTVPMVVLINAGSASASEIVAGALQDHKRATVMGIQSFGKGSVQTIMPMNNGAAIKLTTARYFTPNGRSIQAKGIVPDIIVEDGSDQSHNIHEADLSRHLSNPKDGDASKPETSKLSKEETKEKMNEKKFAETKGPVEPASAEDFQFMQAMNFLKGKPVLKSEAAKVEAKNDATPQK